MKALAKKAIRWWRSRRWLLWESFQPKLKAAPIKGALRGREAARKNLAGRKLCDEIAVFKGLALQALDNLTAGAKTL